MKWLLYGGHGWIGSQITKLIEKETIFYGSARADDEINVEKEILLYKPDRILCLIGRTHGPGFSTIDYLEQKGKLLDNIRDNLYGPLVLAHFSKKYNIHLTYLGTGCIFEGYNYGKGFTEEDSPNFFGSSYSIVKGFTDRLMKFFNSNVLNVRIRMPITNEDSPRNFITKLLKYEKICSIPNSMSVLPDLLPIMLDLSRNQIIGTVNLTNPGVIDHNTVLELVKKYKIPDLKWNNFSFDEQNKILLAGRSNNMLNTDKLQSLYPEILNINDSLTNLLSKN
jgi:3,5-epimerase/4-reductase